MRIGMVLVLTSAVTATMACAPTGEADAPAHVLRGVFATESAEGPDDIAEIEFHADGRYRLSRGDRCVGDACEERGTFAIGGRGHALDLVVDGTQRAYSLPLEIGTVGGALRTKNASLVSGDDNLVEGQSQLVVTSLELVGRGYKLLYECSAPTIEQERQYSRARSKALCALGVGSCNVILSTAESGSPRQLLTDLDVRGSVVGYGADAQVRLNCAREGAYASNVGRGANARISIHQPFYGRQTYEQVRTLLHELGHATGRISGKGGHQPYYEGDPKDSAEWNALIESSCITSAEVRAKCGDSAKW